MKSDRPRQELLSDHSDVLAAAMVIFATVYRESITPQLTEIYLKALGDITVKDFKAAVDHLVKTSKYFPRPSEIREGVYLLQRQAAWHSRIGIETPTTRNRELSAAVEIKLNPDFKASREGLANLAKTLKIAKR